MGPKNQDDHGNDEKDTSRDLLDERSALLRLPSPNSTDRPSMSNLLEYGALTAPDTTGEDPDEPLIQMHNNNINTMRTTGSEAEGSMGEDAWSKDAQKAREEKRFFRVLLFVSMLLLLVAVGGIFTYDNEPLFQKHSPATHPELHSSHSIHQRHSYISRALHPLSIKDPVTDLNVKSYQRPEFSSPNHDLFLPSPTQEQQKKALPTNAWYQNLVLVRGEPTPEQRVYPVPYVVDVVGPIPGIRVHHPTPATSATVIQLTQVLEHGLTVGAASIKTILGTSSQLRLSNKYKISRMTPLGITLEWTDPTEQDTPTDVGVPLTYSSSIVRGMPYATMQYRTNPQQHKTNTDEALLPTIASETPIGSSPVLDGTTELNCESQEPQWVQGEIQLEFLEPDYTWLVFVSKPVRVRCLVPPPDPNPPPFVPGRPVPSPGIVFALQFFGDDDDGAATDQELLVRVALANDCTHGANPITCAATREDLGAPNEYADLLRQHSDLYPGPDTDVTFDFNDKSTHLRFNWDVQSMGRGHINTAQAEGIESDEEEVHRRSAIGSKKEGEKLLMYTLPHHQDMIQEAKDKGLSLDMELMFPTHQLNGDSGKEREAHFCKATLLGPACLVCGRTWDLQEERLSNTSFRAPRPPQNDALPALVEAYKADLQFELPDYFQRGAGDTYFSGKMLAKLGRILTIGEELHEVCSPIEKDSRPSECEGLEIPSPQDSAFLDAVARLRSSVEVWINGTADTPFVYDDVWGGLVSCGCNFDSDSGACRNAFPDCPAFYDPGLDFGNAWYNDHHFHLGYHIYAAAAVTHFDPQWGRDHFEQVLLLVRDIANPSHHDSSFPTFRQKDWYQGSSWASGIAVTPLNGRNQESSSEAIAAYEGVALFGMEMVKAWRGQNRSSSMEVASQIQSYGEILMASEVRSADRYWHVYDAGGRRQYSQQYTPRVIGIMWNTMAQFQTWFGGEAYLAYGIQLLPLTAISEQRDSSEWVKELYTSFAESCDAHFDDCKNQGWSVLVLAILATVGHRNEAIQKAMEIPDDAFTSAGGNGHSLTNTLWYLATRPELDDPLVIEEREVEVHNHVNQLEQEMHQQSDHTNSNASDGQPPNSEAVVINQNFNCSCAETCDAAALDRSANGPSCRDRIVWLMTEKYHTEWEACHQVGLEFPRICGACDPHECSVEEENKEEEKEEDNGSESCPPCSTEVCGGELNKCPIQSAPFLCTEGPSTGGCAPSPWPLQDTVCKSCCQLSMGCED